MKYYIVALFNEKSYETIFPIQKSISKKFKGYRNSPIPHITLSILENPNIEKLTPIIEKIIKPYKKFKIELDSTVSISEQLHSLNLHMQYKGYIKKIKTSLSDFLELNGFHDLISSDSELSISLANVNFSNKDNKHTDMYCDLIKKNPNTITLKVDRFEIWKFSNNRKETCIKSFNLREF